MPETAGTLACTVSLVPRSPVRVSITIPVVWMKKPKLRDQGTCSAEHDGARIQIQFCLASKLQLHHSAFREKFLSN